jgi:hypothetical protein
VFVFTPPNFVQGFYFGGFNLVSAKEKTYASKISALPVMPDDKKSLKTIAKSL